MSAAYDRIVRDLKHLGSHPRAEHAARFFKTGKGEYAEGDLFLGVRVPDVRAVVKRHGSALSIRDIERLLQDEVHELRLAALILLVARYEVAKSAKERKEIFKIYTKNTEHINNWDLVDVSAHRIVGPYLSHEMGHEARKAFIDRYIVSRSLWENRIIVVATAYQIKQGNEKMLFYVARALLHHPHDLIHKAIGWMLREVGKRDRTRLSEFLEEYAARMPRTMLRYALEHYGNRERERYMRMKSKRKEPT